MGWLNKKNNYSQMLEKAKERDQKEKEFEELPTMGRTATPEDKKNGEILLAEEENIKNLEPERKKRKKERQAALEDLLVIDGAELECSLCTAPKGILKVNFDTPSTQQKKTATIEEKSSSSLIFPGNCTKSPNCSLPCVAAMTLGEWKNTGIMKVQDRPPLLLKSTIPCLYGGVEVKITDSGQVNEPEINPEAAPVPAPKKKEAISVSIGRVIRGNPYVPQNATEVSGLPDSVPLNKTYEVEVILKGEGTVTLTVINTDENNGAATVTPSTITKTTKVQVQGTQKTKPGYGGNLKIEARANNQLKAVSEGFSVCCHPINWKDTFKSDIYEEFRLGVMVADNWSSDSDDFYDLDQVYISEVVSYEGINDSPPFLERNSVRSANSGYLIGNVPTSDMHTIPRSKLDLVKEGISEALQLSIYKCMCCGAVDIVMPNSGMKRIHRIFEQEKQWKHQTDKIGQAVTIRSFITGPADCNVKSYIHNLP